MTIEQYAKQKLLTENMDEARAQAFACTQPAINAGVPMELLLATVKGKLREEGQPEPLVFLIESWIREVYEKAEKKETG